MIFILLILLILCIWGLRLVKDNPDYISIKATIPIKGIFAVIILSSHIGSYLSLEPSLANIIYYRIIGYIGQCMVAPYFFYSGYGIFLSYRNKADYVSGFIKKRWLKTQLHFDLSVLIIIGIQLFFSIYYPLRNYVFCWIAWESVGNYNWFVFVILALYLLTYIGLFLDNKLSGDGRLLLTLIILLSGLLWVFLRLGARKESWWFDTIATFPLGMLYAFYRDKVEKWLLESNVGWLFSFFGLLAAYVAWHFAFGVDSFGICSCLFCLFIVVATMKIKIGNPVLVFLGRNAFPIYILQRLPMLLLARYDINLHPAFFIPLTILLVLPFSEVFRRLTVMMDRHWLHV